MRAYRIDTRINSKLEQIQSLNDLATKATSVISDMPGNATRNVHKTEDVIVKIVDLQNEIKEAMKGLVDLKKQILDRINKVEDPELRTLLELRYISYMSWENIASEHPFCELCFERGLAVPVEEVHHKLPLSEGGTHDRCNLIALCKSCHSKIRVERGDRRHDW